MASVNGVVGMVSLVPSKVRRSLQQVTTGVHFDVDGSSFTGNIRALQPINQSQRIISTGDVREE